MSLYKKDNRPRRHGRGGQHQTAKDMSKNKAKADDSETVYLIKIPKGIKYGAKFILTALGAHAEAILPIMARMDEGGNFSFFVRDEDTAMTIKSVNRRIKHTPSGDLLIIFVSETNAPWTKLKTVEKTAIELVVASRADHPNRSLDLSNFDTHQDFTSRDMMMNMWKNNVFLSVMELIEAKYSNIVALSLKGNRLKYLAMASMLPYFAKNLKVLDLSDNQIVSILELEKLKGLNLTTLFLENNPVCEKYSKASDYLSAVQAVFPRISRLDGNECTPLPGAFNDDSEFKEPQAKPGFYGDDPSLRSIIETFVMQYFDAYDGADPKASRKQLLAAYDDANSQFTLCIENLYDESSGKARWPTDNFSDLVRLNHNIRRMDKWGRKDIRHSRVFNGAMDVAAQLCKMPATRHLQDTFIVDVVLAKSSLLVFTVQGLFEEAPFAVSPNIPALNFFTRTFTVTPKENGIVVISDELYLSALTSKRVDRYRKQLAKANAGQVTAPATTENEPDSTTKAKMVQAFRSCSGMNEKYSTMCLAEVNWNFEVAGQNFTSLNEKGLIPKEAFA